MSRPDIPVLVTRGVPEAVRRHLAGRCRLELWEGEGVMPRAELLDRAGPQLRVVANYAVGHDNLDLEACTARGVLATNTPDVVTEATADLAWALLLAAARRVADGDRFLRARRPWIWGPEYSAGSGYTARPWGCTGAAKAILPSGPSHPARSGGHRVPRMARPRCG